MVTIKELKDRKKELCYSNKMISDISGVPVSTLQKIFGGSTETPRYETLIKLERALFPADRDLRVGDPYYRPDGGLYKMHVEEPLEAYDCSALSGYDKSFRSHGKRQGEYTIADMMDLPDGVRMELIDGVLYDTASPTTFHQAIIMDVFMQIAPVLHSADGDCAVFVAPLDVQFEADDDKTLVQPDLLIACGKDKYINETGRILGAPDMVMEVLSPSSISKDRFIKLNKYWQKGVREYWVVDPDRQIIHVYCFGDINGFSEYTFEDRVPLRIFEGKLSVNFASVKRHLTDRLGFKPTDMFEADDDDSKDRDDGPDDPSAA